MNKKGSLNAALLVIIIVAILLLIILMININLFYMVTLLSFYVIVIHYVESSKFDKIEPVLNHLSVIIFFTILYVDSIKPTMKIIYKTIMPSFKTNFAENLFISVITVILINIVYIIICMLFDCTKKDKKLKNKNKKIRNK